MKRRRLERVDERLDREIAENEEELKERSARLHPEHQEWIEQQVAVFQQREMRILVREDQILADRESLQQLDDTLNARRIQYNRDFAELGNGQRALQLDRRRRDMVDYISRNRDNQER